MRDALIAFFGHAPGLMLLRRWRLPRPLLLGNALAMVATVAAMALVAGEHDGRWLRIGGAWAAGHFGWSFLLVWALSTDRAGGPVR